MKVTDAIKSLDELVPTPANGLPDEVFYYISRTTPLINVDTLVQDPIKGTLFAWRDDELTGKGWHIPGGIIRYREKAAERIQAVAQLELGASEVQFDPVPLDVNEIIVHTQRDRAHFISMLYRCTVADDYVIDNENLKENEVGYLRWFKGTPKNLLSWHDIYKKYF